MLPGPVHIVFGKGNKSRSVFLSKNSKKAVRKYLRTRPQPLYEDDPLWLSEKTGDRLEYDSLNDLMGCLSKRAGVTSPGLHAWRRTFSIEMLRNGCDLKRLAELLGHSSMEVLDRYLKLIEDDLKEAHQKGSPVDKWNL